MAKKTLGKPIIRSDEALDRLAEITPADVDAARVFVQKAPAVAKLLDARATDEGQPD